MDIFYTRKRRSRRDRKIYGWKSIRIVIKIFSREGEEEIYSRAKLPRFVAPTVWHGLPPWKNLNVFLPIFFFFFCFSLQYTLHTVSLCILLQRTRSNEKDYYVQKRIKAYIRAQVERLNNNFALPLTLSSPPPSPSSIRAGKRTRYGNQRIGKENKRERLVREDQTGLGRANAKVSSSSYGAPSPSLSLSLFTFAEGKRPVRLYKVGAHLTYISRRFVDTRFYLVSVA